MESKLFKLVTYDGWPPVEAEGLYVAPDEGCVKVLSSPFFVKDLSVSDKIKVLKEIDGMIVDWVCIEKSQNTNIWVMVYDHSIFEELRFSLKGIECNVEALTTYQYLAVNCPENVPIAKFDEVVSTYTEDQCAIAYPSYRH